MKNSQLFEVFKSLSKSEFREFGKFVNSPFHNNRSEVVRFYSTVKKFYPFFESKDLTEEKIFQKIYPGKKFSIGMITKVISLMMKLVTDFFAISGFKEDALGYNVKLLYKLYAKNLPSVFEKKAKETEKLFRKSKHTFEYYESKFNYTSIVSGHFIRKNEKDSVHKLQKEIDDFTEFFFAVILLLYFRLITWSKVYNIKFDLKFYEEVLEFISTHNYEDVTLVYLNYLMVMLLYTEEEKYFFELLKDWDKFEDKLSDTQQKNIYTGLGKYCIIRIEKGDIKFRKQQFDITKKFLEKNIFPEGYLEPYFFTSIVRNASNLKEFKWVEDFIKSHKDKLDPELVEEITHYSLAIIEFDKSNHEKSLKHLSTINPESLNMKLNVKNLSILNYYELNYNEELISSIDTYKHFLSRDKDADKRLKQRDTNFIKFVSALVKIKSDGNSELALPLKKKIEETPYFNLKEWLLQKAGELCK